MKGTRGVLVFLVGLLVAGMVAWATDGLAQTKQPGGPATPGIEKPGERPAPPGAPAAEKKEVEGKIKTMAGNKVTLEDGTQLTIPPTVERGMLKEGMTVKASYEEKGGEKVVTSMDVRPTGGTPPKGKPSEKPAQK